MVKISPARLALVGALLLSSHCSSSPGQNALVVGAQKRQATYLCGSELTNMLVWACGSAGVYGKRADPGYQGVGMATGPDYWPFVGASAARRRLFRSNLYPLPLPRLAWMGGQRQAAAGGRAKRTIVQECCESACDLQTLMRYCN